MKQILEHNKLSLLGFIVLMVLANGHLLHRQLPHLLVYDHGRVLAGEWWRIFTYPLVHVSWYHLVLDMSATLLIWQELKHLSTTVKLMLVSYLSMLVLSVSILFSPYLATCGLCGLSGLAHGLAMFTGLSQVESGFGEEPRRTMGYSGLILLISIISKCFYEALSGQILFSTLHLGELGFPIIHAHLGGALGGLSFYLMYRVTGRLRATQIQPARPTLPARRSSRSLLNQSR